MDVGPEIVLLHKLELETGSPLEPRRPSLCVNLARESWFLRESMTTLPHSPMSPHSPQFRIRKPPTILDSLRAILIGGGARFERCSQYRNWCLIGQGE